MRIVMIGPVYPYKGGIAHFTGLMSRNLAKEHEVISISFRRQYPKILYKHEQKDYGNDVFQVDGTKYWIDTIDPLNWAAVAKNINRTDPDLVIFQWWHPWFAPCYYGIMKFLRRGLRVIFLCHNVLPHEDYPMKRPLIENVFKRVNGFIVDSEQDAEDLQSLTDAPEFRKTVHPTYNAFRIRGISSETAREELGLGAEEEIMLFFGFIREYKGLKHLIRVLPKIREARPKAKLLIVGDFFENNKEEYLELIRSVGCEDMLILKDGYIPDQEVEPYFAASDVVVLPYESATQSGIVQIAYGFEKPVIVTDVGGLPEVVEDGKTGFVIPKGDENALAETLIRFFETKESKDYKTEIEKLSYRFSWDRMNEIVNDLYNNI